jgi:hypothetical protein
MKSTPVHHPLDWDSAGHEHIVFVGADDANLPERLLSNVPTGTLALIYAGSRNSDAARAWAARWPASGAATWCDDMPSALGQLDACLGAAAMGARLYIAATETRIWSVWEVAKRYAMGRDQVRTQCIASAARPVFCVHCRATTPDVRTNIGDCTGCGRKLLVRDHFSRRLGAYMGFQIDAEVPGEIPAIEEIYP